MVFNGEKLAAPACKPDEQNGPSDHHQHLCVPPSCRGCAWDTLLLVGACDPGLGGGIYWCPGQGAAR